MLFSRALLRRHSVLPGFDLALGFTLLYLSLIVLIPLAAAFTVVPIVIMLIYLTLAKRAGAVDAV